MPEISHVMNISLTFLQQHLFQICDLSLFDSSIIVLFSFCLDVEDIKFVINFDYPNSSEDYVHRIGRTGRSNNSGTAYTFFTPGNVKQAKDLIDVLQEAKQVVNPKLMSLADSARSMGRGIYFY